MRINLEHAPRKLLWTAVVMAGTAFLLFTVFVLWLQAARPPLTQNDPDFVKLSQWLTGLMQICVQAIWASIALGIAGIGLRYTHGRVGAAPSQAATEPSSPSAAPQPPVVPAKKIVIK